MIKVEVFELLKIIKKGLYTNIIFEKIKEELNK